MANSIISAKMQITNTGPLDDEISVRPKEILNTTTTPNYASLFSYNYKRITPYAKNTISIPFNEKVDFGKTITATIPFMGDLIHNVYLHFKLPQLSPPPPLSNYLGWANCVGYSMIESIQVRIGETIFDEQNGLFMEIMDYLQTPANKTESRNKCVGRYDNANVLSINALGEQDIYLSLQFWFNKKLSSSLPMLSLTGQSIKLFIRLRPFENLVVYDGNIEPIAIPIQDSSVIIDYYLLSEPERGMYLSETQDYLIEQWQYMKYEIQAGLSTSRFLLEFSQCVKEIVFVIVQVESEDNNDFFNFGNRDASSQGGEFITNVGLAFDGKTRQEKLPESFVRLQMTSRYHTFGGNRNIYSLSFAENPEINQPSGTVNFSRYDNVELLLDFIDNVPQCRLHILGIVYNKINIDPISGIQIEYVS